MARDEAPPFARGNTFYNGMPIDTSNLGGPNLEGKEFVFEVNSPDDNSPDDPSGRLIRVRIVRNVSTISLLPGRLAVFQKTAPFETKVDGYTVGVADRPAGVIDEFLPTIGVPPNDLFYLVIKGPAAAVTVDSGLTALAIGDRVVPGTGTTKVSADAGKIQKMGGTPVVADMAARVGYADQVQAAATTLTNIVVHLAD